MPASFGVARRESNQTRQHLKAVRERWSFIVDLLAVSRRVASAAFLRCVTLSALRICPDVAQSRCWYHCIAYPCVMHAETAQKPLNLAVENPTNDTDDTKTVITRHTDDTAGPHYECGRVK